MRRVLAFLLSLVTLTLLVAAGCGDPTILPPPTPATSGDGGSSDLICLANNCTSDFECKDCTGGHTVCEISSRRCLACGPGANNKTCPDKYTCTKYGDCVPEGTTCAEDANGLPTVSCTTNAQCAACSPAYRVCDPLLKTCVGCTTADVSQCQKTEYCNNDKCTANCPTGCTANADCQHCGAGTSAARACYRGACTQCSPDDNPQDTTSGHNPNCTEGLSCTDRGSCQAICGVASADGFLAGGAQCTSDNDCGLCRTQKHCDQPVNGGFGKCVVPARGCSEFGPGLFTLPAPYDKYTNLCSTDTDCRNQGIDYNIGKTLRDFTGLSALHDATVPYGMNVCAEVDIIGSRSCGVCVPCKKDADCKPIGVDSIAGQLAGGIIGIATQALVAKTMDSVFGRGEHSIQFYCEDLAAGYGVCLPCGNPLARCGNDTPPASGPCTHDVCTQGGQLGVQCGSCTAAVCAEDPYCCIKKWDAECVKKTEKLCPSYPSCNGQSCKDKSDGWYCSETVDAATKSRGLGTYQCTGGNLQTGNTCPNSTRGDPSTAKYCHPLGGNWKSTAELGTDGKPACYTTAAPVPQ